MDCLVFGVKGLDDAWGNFGGRPRRRRMWSSGGKSSKLASTQGLKIAQRKPISCNPT